jgi:hypothetical protein
MSVHAPFKRLILRAVVALYLMAGIAHECLQQFPVIRYNDSLLLTAGLLPLRANRREAAIVPNKQGVFETGMQLCVCLSALLAAVKPCD